ncbi:hypothetical protein L207DRAFT_484365 [Hyaloscypha variabilis F]|uniref:Lysine decarboxylase-like protein-like protein n=1 Tax=Hyaloscypha variabilis (strain UAMH 11265 / GT02V1 / F) TaxID=1149755 RepID=A0A2J6RXG1_HYAVF|nr:hypothetical protein L207DRAFT_484365 [Hyaloscypha variabilis F]
MASGGASPALSIRSETPDLPNSTPHGLSKLSNVLSNTTNVHNSSPPKIKICVFLGASPGNSPAHMEAARSLARVFASNNISLVYGGGTVGLMGEIARTLVSLSGPDSVHGIIPAPLVKYERGPDSDIALDGAIPEYKVYGKTTVVKDMHTRKQMMAQEVLAGASGSGFVALSGGYGTLEELMEVVTWNQLGIHNRGVVVYNVEGYWDGLLQWVKGSVEAGFVGKGNQEIIAEAKTAEEVVRALKEYRVAAGRFKLEWGNE